jgi:hypothetical protein
MSRHRLRPRAGYQGYEIAVGWDRALGSFYAQVFTHDPDATADQGATRLWLGAAESITDPATVVDAVRGYAEVPAHLIADLKADSAGEGSRTGPGVPHAAATAIEQFTTAVLNDNAEAAVAILHALIDTRSLRLLAQVIGWAIDHRLRELTADQLAEAAGMTAPAIYGIAIVSPAGTHYALATPERLVVGLARVDRSRLRAYLAALGWGPDRYAYRLYRGDRPAELFSLTPLEATP